MPVTPVLSEPNRQRLDGIVAKMQQNGETDDYIQNVVNDFKTKYGGIPASALSQPDSSTASPDKVAIVQELYRRLPELPTEKAAIVSELANRFGIGPDAGQRMQANAIPKALRPDSDEIASSPMPVPGGMAVTQVPVPYDAPVRGARQIVHGVEQMTEPGLQAKAGGVDQIIRGAGNVAQPFALPALGVAAMAAPVPTVAALAGGALAQTGTEAGLKAAGVPDEYANLAGDVAGLAGGTAGAKFGPELAENAGTAVGKGVQGLNQVVNSKTYNGLKDIAAMVPGVGHATYIPMRGAQVLVNLLSKLVPDVVAEQADTAAASKPAGLQSLVNSKTYSAIKDIAGMVPGGNVVYGAMHGLKGLANIANMAGKLSPDIVDEIIGNPAKPVSTEIASKVEVSPHISVESSSNALGTKPEAGVTLTSSSGKGVRSSDALSPETQQLLIQARKNGSLTALPADQRTQLIRAVKNADDAKVQSILAPAHSAIDNVVQAVQNKLAVLAAYARRAGIDVGEITTPEAKQAFVDAAHQHGRANNMPVPAKGYRGVSDSTWNLLLQHLNGQ